MKTGVPSAVIFVHAASCRRRWSSRGEARIAREELEQVGGVGRGVDPAEARLEAAQVPLVAEVRERIVDEPPVAGGVEHRIGVLERGEDREIESGERPEQDRLGPRLPDASPQVLRQLPHERAALVRLEEPLLVDAARHDAVPDFVPPEAIGVAEERNGFAHEAEGRLSRRHGALRGEGDPERLAPPLADCGRCADGDGRRQDRNRRQDDGGRD
ncbi:MAG TPA: hypothetical protein VL691_12570 [Vicinamibacteria bacterium]|nr:hypothetical protein [Vicinamibacteria bacterium]